MNNRPPSRELVTAIAGALAEWLFVMLPLLVVAIVTSTFGTFYSVLESPEWAFGASVLAGQALVRFVYGAIHAGRLLVPRVVLFVAAVLVIVFVPAIVILVLVLLSELSEDYEVSGLLASLQVSWFCLSSVVLIIFSTIAHLWTERTRVRTSRSR